MSQLPYIVFPAFRLQTSLRETFGGEGFWKKLRKKMDKKVKEQRLEKERQDILNEELKQKDDEYKRKMEYFEERVADMNKKYKKD